MTQIKILTYSLDLALSNEYLEVIATIFEPKIFNKKVYVLFYFFTSKNKISIYLEKSNFNFESIIWVYSGQFNSRYIKLQ